MKKLTIVAALLVTGLALPLAAQTADETTTAAEQLGLSTGTPEVGATYVREEFTDWELRCVSAPEGQPDPCQLYQLLLDIEGNAVAEFNLFDVPDEGDLVAGATIVTPLDTLLTGQLRMAVDNNQPRVYPFSFCQAIGCFVRLGLTSDDLHAFEAGNVATVAIVPLPAPDQVVALGLSLAGFTAGFAALEAYNAEARLQIEALIAAQDGTEPASE
jgi:invasion protein IalB